MTLLMTSGTPKISSMFHYRALIITEKALAIKEPHYGTVYHVNTESLGVFKCKINDIFKSNTRHSRKTAFSVIAYSLNLKYLTCVMYFYG